MLTPYNALITFVLKYIAGDGAFIAADLTQTDWVGWFLQPKRKLQSKPCNQQASCTAWAALSIGKGNNRNKRVYFFTYLVLLQVCQTHNTGVHMQLL